MSQGTTIWLARHAEAHNPRAVLYGRLPRVNLSVAGRRQAEALAQALATRPIAAVYSSPMLRARQTAALVAHQHPSAGPAHVDVDLHEIRSGWQGEPLSAIDGIAWDFYAHPRGAADESLAAIRDRMQRWVGRVLKRHAGGEVVGVSHGDPVLVLVAALKGLLLEIGSIRPQSYPPPGAVYRLLFDGAGQCRDIELVATPADGRHP